MTKTTAPAVPSVAGDEAEALIDALVEALFATEFGPHSLKAKNAKARLFSAVALLRERAERAEADVQAFRFYSDEFCQDETAEQAAHAMFDAVVLHRRRAEAAESRASAAEAESERLRTTLREIAASQSDAIGMRALARAALSVGETETAKGPGGARRGGR